MRISLTAAGLLAFVVSLTAADRMPANGGDIEITPLVHASVQIEFGLGALRLGTRSFHLP